MTSSDSDRPAVLAHQRFLDDRESLAGLHLAQRFRCIHETNMWGAEASTSGLGSEIDATAVLRAELPRLLQKLAVTSLLDAPCGDAGWISRVDLGVRYLGVDIVPTLIERLQARAAAGEIKGEYHLADITGDTLPRCDAILCRDALVHLSFANIDRAVANFRASGASWLITTTFPEWQTNADCEDGDWRALNFVRAPFCWGAPVELLNENCTEAGGGWRDKSLGVWGLAETGGAEDGGETVHSSLSALWEKGGGTKSVADEGVRSIDGPEPLTRLEFAALIRATLSHKGRGEESSAAMPRSHRQRGRIFHLAQRKTRFDRGDAVEPGQLVLQKCFIGRQVGGDHAQQIVAVAGHQVALQHLIPFRNRLGKPVEVFLFLPRQFYRDEDADMEPQRFLVDGRDIARDHAALLQQFDPSVAWRHRQADLVGQFLHGGAAVGLQQAEDFTVDGIQGVHWDKLCLAGFGLVIYPNLARYVARI